MPTSGWSFCQKLIKNVFFLICCWARNPKCKYKKCAPCLCSFCLNILNAIVNLGQINHHFCPLCQSCDVIMLYFPCCFIVLCHVPADTLRSNDVLITPKRRHFDVITSKWRRFDVITTLLLRYVFSGVLACIMNWCTAWTINIFSLSLSLVLTERGIKQANR